MRQEESGAAGCEHGQAQRAGRRFVEGGGQEQAAGVQAIARSDPGRLSRGAPALLLFALFASLAWRRSGAAGSGALARRWARHCCGSRRRCSSSGSSNLPAPLPSRMQFVRFFARNTHSSPLRSCAGAASLFLKRPFHSTLARRGIADMETVVTTDRLAHLRQLMRDHQVDVYSTAPHLLTVSHMLTSYAAVVPSEDSHQSEYIAPCDARRGLTTSRPPQCPAANAHGPQNSYAVSRAPLELLSSHSTRPRLLPMDAISTRLRNSWTTTGSF